MSRSTLLGHFGPCGLRGPSCRKSQGRAGLIGPVGLVSLNDHEHVRGISIVAWPWENGAPKPDWKPGTDAIADIRPGSFLERSYEERQKKPDDLEAQEGQRPIAVHALENLAHSDTGVVMLRRLLREQLQR